MCRQAFNLCFLISYLCLALCFMFSLSSLLISWSSLSVQPAEPVLPEESGPSTETDCVHTGLQPRRLSASHSFQNPHCCNWCKPHVYRADLYSINNFHVTSKNACELLKTFVVWCWCDNNNYNSLDFQVLVLKLRFVMHRQESVNLSNAKTSKTVKQCP